MILDDIIAYKKDFVARSKSLSSLSDLKKEASERPNGPSFLQALKKAPIGLIAEIKKASPSKGLIRNPFDVKFIAESYQKSNVTCVSCLTDEKFFQGSKEDFILARKILKIPMIRKDFVIDPYQIYEAKAMGANAILLIVAILDENELEEYQALANELGMDALVEIHDQKELEIALKIDSKLIGINNRNLKLFKTDLKNSVKLIPQIPNDKYIISESGIHSRDHILSLLKAGAHGFLIGETFMRESNIEDKIQELIPELQ